MADITTGTKAVDFTFDTPFEQGVKLSEKVKETKKTYLVFLRYYGCTLCQLDMREYAAAYNRFKEKGAQILVVLQSPPSTINAQMKKGDLPYDIVCDPDMGLYKIYNLPAAESKEKMIDPATEGAKYMEKKKKLEEMGLTHGAYEGEETQLPGVFLLDPDMNVLYAHRAKTVLDMPSVDDMIAKL